MLKNAAREIDCSKSAGHQNVTTIPEVMHKEVYLVKKKQVGRSFFNLKNEVVMIGEKTMSTRHIAVEPYESLGVTCITRRKSARFPYYGGARQPLFAPAELQPTGAQRGVTPFHETKRPPSDRYCDERGQ